MPNQIVNRRTFPSKVVISYPPAGNYEYLRSEIVWPQPFSLRDGCVVFQTSAGNLRLIGGWSGAWTPATRNEQWESTDGGLTWIQLANAPWQGRHEFAHGYRADGKFWIWGGDPIQVPTGQRDVWTFDVANGWIQVTADWGNVAGDRVNHAFVVHKDYMYLIGGSIQDCVRSNDGINWVQMCASLPFGYGFENGYAITHKGSIYITGGSVGDRYAVWKSVDDGVTFNHISDLPTGLVNSTARVEDSTYWCRLWSQWSALFYIAGTGNFGNKVGMWVSRDDGITWKLNPSYPIEPAHARAIGSFNDSFYTIAGTNTDFIENVTRIPYVSLSYKVVYSLRKVNSLYAGNCIRVRRDSDNTEQNIGFVGNDLDTSSLSTFVGSNSGYITKWYDQSGNGYDLVQATQASQPRIVSVGVIDVINGKPAAYFSATSKTLSYGSDINISSQYVISAVCQTSATDRILGASSVASSYLLFMYNDGPVFYHNNGDLNRQFACESSTASVTTGTQNLVEFYRNRMNGYFYKNAVILPITFLNTTVPKTMPARNDSPQYFKNLGAESGSLSFTGYLQEFVIRTGYVEDSSNTAIQSDINGYWGIY